MNANQKFYQKNWFIYLCMLIFPPAGIALLWIYNKKSSTKFKGIISAIAAIWFVLLITSDSSTPTDTDKMVSNDDSPVVENTVSAESSLVVESTLVELETSTEFTDTSSEPESNIPETDLEIITRDGHPTYYGSVAVSHAIWDDVPKKITFGDKSYTFGDKPILYMSAYMDSDLIRDICVYFSSFENPVNLTMEDVLPIVSSYMPYDIINEYYEYKGSKLLVPDDDNNNEHIKYYVLSYGLTEEGETAYYEHVHEYSGSIDVIITVNENDIVNSFSISFGQPRWMYSLELNSYHEETWECNLIDYASTTTESTTNTLSEQETVSDTIPEASTDNDSDNTQPSDQNASTSNDTEVSTVTSNNFETPNNTEQQNTTAQYVLNTNTRKIHIPSCSSVSQIKSKNYATSNLSIAELEAQGYQRCGRCLK